MTFDAILAGSAVFVDANVFVYYFQPHPVFGPACRQLLLRVENNELQGYTSAHVLSDVVHRVITLEAANVFNRGLTGMASWLKQHPGELQQLSRSRSAVDDISLMGIRVLPVTSSLVSRAADFSRQYGLLTSDALIVSVMRDQGLTLLASHDGDFDRVPGLTRYAPA